MAQMVWSRVSRKQVNVIYVAAKKGEIRLERWMASEMYKLADETEQIIDWNGSASKLMDSCRQILDAVFAKDFDKAQSIIDRTFDISLYGKKAVEKMDRTVIA